MTRKSIEITFNNALAQARTLDECAERLEQMASGNLVNITSELNAVWTGNEAQSFLSKTTLIGTNVLKTAKRLRKLAESLRQVARIFRESELKALEIARQRSFNS